MVIVERPPEPVGHDIGRHIPLILGLLIAGSTVVAFGFLTEPGPIRNQPMTSLDTPPGILETWVATYNSGEIESLLALYSENAVINGTLLSLDHDYIRAVHSLNASWSERVSLSSCVHIDVDVVRCDYQRSNDMLQRAGVIVSGLIEFGFDEFGSIRRSDLTLVNPELPAFEGAFSAWLESDHPEVASSTRFGQVLVEGEAEEILALVDEFVDQSEVYPLSR